MMFPMWKWAKRHPWRAGVVVVIGGLLIFSLLWGPWIFEGDHLTKNKAGELPPSAGILVTGFRTMVIALLAGGVAALGLFYTHRNHELAQQQFKQTQQQFQHTQEQFVHAQEQFEHTRVKDNEQAQLTREGQVTGRYVEAIKLLGADDITQRLGGIYSLERIMLDSEKDHQTIVEVLSAFVRHVAHVPRVKKARAGGVSISAPQRPTAVSEDVQAALTVLGRRPKRPEVIQINLKETDLRRADLSRARLSHADLGGAKLDRADLASCDLADTSLDFSDLADADLSGANLQHADLARANLTGASLYGANLTDADLEGADLRGANLHTARGLTAEQLMEAILGPTTVLPPALAQDPGLTARMAEEKNQSTSPDE